LLFITYLYVAIYGSGYVETVTFILVSIFVIIAFATFVWPLLGAHTLLQEQKGQRKREVAQRIEAVADELHERVDTHDLKEVETLKNALDGLVTERGVLDKVSTWPWEPETMRLVTTHTPVARNACAGASGILGHSKICAPHASAEFVYSSTRSALPFIDVLLARLWHLHLAVAAQ
jgi:hypothetical protein